jgi:hypothetical protein
MNLNIASHQEELSPIAIHTSQSLDQASLYSQELLTQVILIHPSQQFKIDVNCLHVSRKTCDEKVFRGRLRISLLCSCRIIRVSRNSHHTSRKESRRLKFDIWGLCARERTPGAMSWSRVAGILVLGSMMVQGTKLICLSITT